MRIKIMSNLTEKQKEYLNQGFERRAQSISTRSNKTKVDIQQFMNDLFRSVIENNTKWGAINTLFSSIDDRAVDKKSLKTWIVKHTPLVLDKETNLFKRTKQGKWSIDLLNKGMIEPWYTYKAPYNPPVKTWDKEKSFAKLLKAVDKELSLANDANDEKAIALLSLLKDSLDTIVK
jgi:hypothetical protein